MSMDPLTAGLIGLAIIFILMFLRMPVGPAFLIVGFCGMWFLTGFKGAGQTIVMIPYTTTSNYIWTVCPPFILMGYLAAKTGIAEEFYDGVRRWVGSFPGGLASAVILGNTAFGAVCGMSLAASVTFTSISLPEMRKYGYADTLSLGSIFAGGNLSLLIPPSTGFILYGAITRTSIARLFIAGIMPGLLLTVIFIGVIYYICWRNPEAGPPSPRTTFREKLRAGSGMWAIIVVFLVIMGGLYVGLFTPTEAGAAGVAIVFVLGLVKRKLSWQGFIVACLQTAAVWGMIMLLIIGVMAFNQFLGITTAPLAIASYFGELTRSPILMLFILMALFFILGMFLDIIAMILLMIPILFPVITNLGIDPIQFGVLVVLLSGVGAISPPYGLTVYALSAIVKDVPISTMFKGVLPFIGTMLICIVILVFVPQISTWLPSHMMPPM